MESELQVENQTASPKGLEKRNFFGWIALALIFAFLIQNSVLRSVAPKAATVKDFSNKARMIEMTVDLAGMQPNGKGVSESVVSALIDVRKETEPFIGKNLSAERWHLLASYGTAKKYELKNYPNLLKSKLPEDQALVELISSQSLTQAELDKGLVKFGKNRSLKKIVHYLVAANSGLKAPAVSTETVLKLILVGLLIFGLMTSSVAAWLYFIYWRNRVEYVPAKELLAPITALDSDRLALLAAAVMAGFVLIQILAGFLPAGTGSFVSAGVILAGLPMLIRVGVNGRKFSFAEFGLKTTGLLKHTFAGFIAFAIEFPITIMLALAASQLFVNLPPPSHPIQEELTSGSGILSTLSLFLAAAVIAPFWEEICFRGLMLPAMQRWIGFLGAAIVTSLLFAAIHPQGPILIIALGGVAMASCYLRKLTGSLVPSIIMHAFHNGFILTISLLMFR